MAPLVHLITGANKGIGYEATRILAEKHRDQAIVLLGTRSWQNGEAAITKMKRANPSFDYANVQLVQIDVSKRESIQAAADFVKTNYGHVHVLINNAGIDGDTEGFEMCFNVNAFGIYDTLEAFHPLLVPNQSSNIVVASTLGASSLSAMPRSLRSLFEAFNMLDISTVRSLVDDWIASAHDKPSEHPWPSSSRTYIGAYGVSKTFVMALTRKWAADHPEIKTTLVCPGYCATDLTNHAGYLTAAQGGQRILFPIFHPNKTQTGKFYSEGREHHFK